MTPVFGYLRISGQSQADGDGFERQRQAISAHAARADFEIVQWFEDVHTGKDEWEKRPGWSSMMETLNGVRTILVERLDRVARSVMVQELIIADLAKREVSLVTSAGETSADLEPERVAFRQILAVFAQYERASIVRKMADARRRIREKGERCDGAKPFGAHRDHPEEVKTLAIMKGLREGGMSTNEIAVLLNREGMKPRRGEWYGSTVARVLRRAGV